MFKSEIIFGQKDGLKKVVNGLTIEEEKYLDMYSYRRFLYTYVSYEAIGILKERDSSVTILTRKIMMLSWPSLRSSRVAVSGNT